MSQSPMRTRMPGRDAAEALAPRPPFDASVTPQESEVSSGRRMSETNRGLRMILVAAVAVVLISWGGTVGSRYIRYLEVQQLVSADQDALRVMCAIEPPTEHQIGWMHICESAALGEAKTDQEQASN